MSKINDEKIRKKSKKQEEEDEMFKEKQKHIKTIREEVKKNKKEVKKVEKSRLKNRKRNLKKKTVFSEKRFLKDLPLKGILLGRDIIYFSLKVMEHVGPGVLQLGGSLIRLRGPI